MLLSFLYPCSTSSFTLSLSSLSLLLSPACPTVFPQLWTSDNQVEGEDTEEPRDWARPPQASLSACHCPGSFHHDHQHWDHLTIIIVVQLSPSFFYLGVSTFIFLLSVYCFLFCSNCGEREWGVRVGFKLFGGRVHLEGLNVFWVGCLSADLFVCGSNRGVVILGWWVRGQVLDSWNMQQVEFLESDNRLYCMYSIHINGLILD